ncbi:hypothetical protein LSH36_439g02012 [Paralvinella palmiformis]|uniref:EF-hand domain-containing protein n=1 Tax=Paralvinella palmiformis TaxID=53620 RepID=A0AAD9JAY9_9ANNE|nr:hypothetical protein LSH36_439g02012 [Paralvinella palmiformis]
MYGEKSSRASVPRLWNELLNHIKFATSKDIFVRSKGILMAISRREARMGFELLDDESSESEQEHFSMTAVSNNNKNKSKEKHNWSPRKKSDQRCCGVQIGILYLLIVVVCAGVGVLSLYTYNLHIKLQQLQAQVESVSAETSSNGHRFRGGDCQQFVCSRRLLKFVEPSSSGSACIGNTEHSNLDVTGGTSVKFKQMKKMKKRRELDALVNGKMGRRKKGQHELLRNESESSEVDEFNIPEKAIMREISSCNFCTMCSTVCGIFLLISCMAAIAGLVWVHIELKKEVDMLRSQLDQVQITAPQSLQQVVKKQQVLENIVHKLQDENLRNVQWNISYLYSQISALNTSVTNVMKQSAAGSGQPPENAELMKSIATLGSTQHSLQSDISKLQNVVSSQAVKVQMIDAMASDINSLNHTVIENFRSTVSHIQYLLNKTESLDLRFSLSDAKSDASLVPNTDKMIQDAIHSSLKEFVKNISLSDSVQDDLNRLESLIRGLQTQVYAMNVSLETDIIQTSKELSLTTVRLDDRITVLTKNLSSFHDITAVVIKWVRACDFLTRGHALREVGGSNPGRGTVVGAAFHPVRQLARFSPPSISSNNLNESISFTSRRIDDLIRTQTVLRTKPPLMNSVLTSKRPIPPTPGVINAHNGDTATTGSNPVYLSLSGIYNTKDVDDNFAIWDTEPNQKLSYGELEALKPTPTLSGELFDQFDKDHDQALSKEELLSALGFTTYKRSGLDYS